MPVACSVFDSADVLVTSPRKFFIFIVKRNIYRIKVYQRYLMLILKTRLLVVYCSGHAWNCHCVILWQPSRNEHELLEQCRPGFFTATPVRKLLRANPVCQWRFFQKLTSSLWETGRKKYNFCLPKTRNRVTSDFVLADLSVWSRLDHYFFLAQHNIIIVYIILHTIWWCIFLQQCRVHMDIGNSKNYLGIGNYIQYHIWYRRTFEPDSHNLPLRV